MNQDFDVEIMNRALILAENAAAIGEVPVGAIVTCDDRVISEAFNLKESTQNPIGHAEVLAIQAAAKAKNNWRLSDCTLYVTLEPCILCVGAITQSRIGRVVYGTPDPKAGAIESVYQIFQDRKLNHFPVVSAGVLQNESSLVLKKFFRKLRLDRLSEVHLNS